LIKYLILYFRKVFFLNGSSILLSLLFSSSAIRFGPKVWGALQVAILFKSTVFQVSDVESFLFRSMGFTTFHNPDAS